MVFTTITFGIYSREKNALFLAQLFFFYFLPMSDNRGGFTLPERPGLGRKPGGKNPNGGRKKKHVKGQTRLGFTALSESNASLEDSGALAGSNIVRIE